MTCGTAVNLFLRQARMRPICLEHGTHYLMHQTQRTSLMPVPGGRSSDIRPGSLPLDHGRLQPAPAGIQVFEALVPRAPDVLDIVEGQVYLVHYGKLCEPAEGKHEQHKPAHPA